MPKRPSTKTAEFEKALRKPDASVYVLRLYISGMTPRSRVALTNLKKLCEHYLKGQYQLEVIDLYQQPELAAKYQVLATPTLLRTVPPPLRRLIGDLSDMTATLRRLGVSVESGTT